MRKSQRFHIGSVCRELGSSKTKHLIKRIADSGKTDFSLIELQEWTGMNLEHSKQAKEAINSFECPESFCVAMEMQDEMISMQLEERSNTKLVMTGPISESNIGYTMGNFRRLIETAQNEIMLVGYVFNNIKGQMNHILESLISATERDVDVKIFFERGSSARELIKNWDKGQSHKMPQLYHYKRKKNQNSILHAKALIRDGNTIFVTSANLTGSAMEKNIEMGILHQGRLASEAKKFLLELIDAGYMVRAN